MTLELGGSNRRLRPACPASPSRSGVHQIRRAAAANRPAPAPLCRHRHLDGDRGCHNRHRPAPARGRASRPQQCRPPASPRQGSRRTRWCPQLRTARRRRTAEPVEVVAIALLVERQVRPVMAVTGNANRPPLDLAGHLARRHLAWSRQSISLEAATAVRGTALLHFQIR